jgi:hypothetical protein
MLRAEEDTAQVDAHDPLVVVDRRVGERRAAGDAGDVQHGIDLAERVECRPEHRLDVRLFAHVALERHDCVAQLFGGLGGSALRSLLKWYVGPRYDKIESASDGVEHPPGAPKIESDKIAIATHGGLKYVLDIKNGKSLSQRYVAERGPAKK